LAEYPRPIPSNDCYLSDLWTRMSVKRANNDRRRRPPAAAQHRQCLGSEVLVKKASVTPSSGSAAGAARQWAKKSPDPGAAEEPCSTPSPRAVDWIIGRTVVPVEQRRAFWAGCSRHAAPWVRPRRCAREPDRPRSTFPQVTEASLIADRILRPPKSRGETTIVNGHD